MSKYKYLLCGYDLNKERCLEHFVDVKLIGIYDSNMFLKTPELQEKAFIANAQRNKWVLRRDIKRFVGKKMNGVVITESGILAAAHLAGPGSVKKYLRSYGQNGFSDAFGTSIRYYMKKFVMKY